MQRKHKLQYMEYNIAIGEEAVTFVFDGLDGNKHIQNVKPIEILFTDLPDLGKGWYLKAYCYEAKRSYLYKMERINNWKFLESVANTNAK